jgi:hypothetical protein
MGLNKERTPQKPNNDALKQRIKKAWAEGDLVAFMAAGLEAGFDLLTNFITNIWDKPIAYKSFLDYTDQLFDAFILETCQKEKLDFVGGKLFLSYKISNNIALQADFYFQDVRQNWVLKQKKGRLDSSRFSDWETEPELIELRKSKKLEYPIEPPAGM